MDSVEFMGVAMLDVASFMVNLLGRCVDSCVGLSYKMGEKAQLLTRLVDTFWKFGRKKARKLFRLCRLE
jgi:hypothetical protein